MSKASQRWERARAQTRSCIIEAAARVFQESGYADASMNRVAEVAGVTKATVYAHFRDKAGLFVTVMDHHASGIPAPVLATPKLSTLREKLDYVAAEIQALASHEPSRRFCQTLQRSANGAGAYVQHWESYFVPYRRYVASALAFEGADTAEDHAELFLQMMLQAHSLHPCQTPITNAAATLALFKMAFAGRAKPT